MSVRTTPTQPSPTPARAGAMALVAGGCLFAIGNLLHPLQHNDAAYDRSTWEAAHLVILASIPLLLLGWPVLHDVLRARGAGRVSLAAAVLTVVGFVGMGPGLVAEAFVAPRLGYEGMKDLEAGGFGVVTGALGMCFVAALVPLFFALRRARFVGALLRWSLPAQFVLLLGASSGTSKAAGAVIIGATAAYGAAIVGVGATLLRAPATTTSVEARIDTTMRPTEPAR